MGYAEKMISTRSTVCGQACGVAATLQCIRPMHDMVGEALRYVPDGITLLSLSQTWGRARRQLIVWIGSIMIEIMSRAMCDG